MSSDPRRARDNIRASRNSSNTDVRPESPLSDRSPRKRDGSRKRAPVLTPQTPYAAPGSAVAPKRPRSYSNESQSDVVLEEVFRPGDKIISVDLEEIERNIRAGTPPSSFSQPKDSSLLNDSHVSQRGPKTSTPKKSTRKHGHKQEPLLKQVLKKSTSRSRHAPSIRYDSSVDSNRYDTAPESFIDSSMGSRISPIVDDTSYRSNNSTARALFSQQGAAPLERHDRSRSRSRHSPSAGAPACKLVTPLMVHTGQEVNAVSVTGQILVISQTLVRSADAPDDIHGLINELSQHMPIISNEMCQTDIDHDNETSKHEVFVGRDAILIQRITTIHRGRDRNSFDTDDRRTYRFICEGDLLPEDRRDKQTKMRHLTIVAESSTIKCPEEIEKSERVMLIFDAVEKPTPLTLPMPVETSLIHADEDITSKPSSFKDSPVTFDEHVRVTDHSMIKVMRKARVHATRQLWDEPLTELKEQRIYTQRLADDADCEPMRVTRSHSLSRQATRARSPSASRRPDQSSRLERSRAASRHQNLPSIHRPKLPPLVLSSEEKISHEVKRPRRVSIEKLGPEITPSAPLPTGVLTAVSPLKDEPARREARPHNSTTDLDDTVRDSVSLPDRRSSHSPAPQTLHHQDTLRLTPSSSSVRPVQQMQQPLCRQSPVEKSQRPPLRTPRSPSRSSEEPRPMIVDEDTSAGSSVSPTQNRTPTAVSPRRTRLASKIYQSPAARDPSMDEWDRMLDRTQPVSPAAAIARTIPDDLIPVMIPATSDSRLARASRVPLATTSLRSPHRSYGERPLGPAKSCQDLCNPALQPVSSPYRNPSSSYRTPPLRRSVSDHSIFTPAPSSLRGVPVVPANSAVALSSPFRRQQYVTAPAPAPAPAPTVEAPVPRPRTSIKRKSVDANDVNVKRPRSQLPTCTTARPHSVPRKQQHPVGANMALASVGATAVNESLKRPAAVQHLDMKVEKMNGKPKKSSSPEQKNVELVSNPEDYDKGEILMKKLTLEAKINGHNWIMSVNFALRSEVPEMIRFQPKRVRIDDQTLWEETENWSQTSLTPVTGPRTVARGSNSYDQLAPVPVTPTSLPKTTIQTTPSAAGGINVSTQTTSSMNHTAIHVMTKSQVTPASSSKSKSAEKKNGNSSKKSNNSNSSEKKKRSY